MKYTILFLSLCLLILSCNQLEEIEPATFNCELSRMEETHPMASDFQQLLEDIIPFTPGIQVAITSSDGSQWTGAAGYATLDTKVRLENCHRFLIASISKVVTATMIFQLQDEGLLNINDPLTDWLEEDLIDQLANYDKVTIAQLLNHTSGMPDYLNARQTFDALNKPFFMQSQREKLTYAYGEAALNAPGEAFNYSNTNFVLLGLIVEEARQMELWKATETYITNPLSLSSFSMGRENDPIPDDVVRPYMALKGGKYFDITQYAVSDAATGDGGVLSNMQDLNTFIEALFSGQLISSESLALMTTNLTLIGEDESDFDWEDEAYGLGITRYNTPKGLAYGHTGFSGSYASLVFYFPEEQVTLSMITNGIDVADADNDEDRKLALRDDFLDLLFEK